MLFLAKAIVAVPLGAVFGPLFWGKVCFEETGRFFANEPALRGSKPYRTSRTRGEMFVCAPLFFTVAVGGMAISPLVGALVAPCLVAGGGF